MDRESPEMAVADQNPGAPDPNSLTAPLGPAHQSTSYGQFEWGLRSQTTPEQLVSLLQAW